ncbi:MAG: hypothetical protein ACHQU0_03315 [Candidatus Paceibacteria bacterium]
MLDKKEMKFIRFIYVYRVKATGRAVYVGSTFDVASRDKQHCTAPRVPFDYEIHRLGREALSLEIVEAVSCATAAAAIALCVARENQWMDLLRTFRIDGCFNFNRARVLYSSESCREAAVSAHRAATKKSWENKDSRASRSAAKKKYYEDPTARAITAAAVKAALGTPEARAKRAAISTPELQARRTARLHTPEVLAKKAAALRTLESRARMSAAIKSHYARKAATA